MGANIPSIVRTPVTVSPLMLSLRRHASSRVPRGCSRFLASVADTVAPAPYQIFDRYAKVLQKDRSATPNRVKNSRTVDYLRDETADRLIERMQVSSSPRFFFGYLNAPRVGYQAQVQHRARSGLWPRSLCETTGDRDGTKGCYV